MQPVVTSASFATYREPPKNC